MLQTALIISLPSQHSHHAQILADLKKAFNIKELSLNPMNGAPCNQKILIDSALNNVSLVVITLSNKTKNDDCICYAIQSATAKGIKVLGIWDSGAHVEDITPCMVKSGDFVTNYPSDLIDIIRQKPSIWIDPNGETIEKRSIKKHICG
ncbi:hypothetical protein GTP55_21250 [Duganella sp. FT109W]|uniref:Thoeris protein ThsB TIR-like domain-containing protein n=1 Tax=Duganella margarita TaxID=2692170 RepID=A0ABW9WL74_9BURK|nr:TIR domain-containing protein [Duganella margarita]MYN41889.1 hypothetical protein [Duganella margarita]